MNPFEYFLHLCDVNQQIPEKPHLFLISASAILTLRQSQTLRAEGVNSLVRLIDMVIDNRLSYTRTTIDFVMSLCGLST